MMTLYYCSTQKFPIVKGYHTNPTLTFTQAIQAERRNNKQAVFCPMKGMVYRLCRVRLIMPADRGRLPGGSALSAAPIVCDAAMGLSCSVVLSSSICAVGKQKERRILRLCWQWESSRDCVLK